MSGSGTGTVPGRTLGQLLIAEPAVTPEGRLSTWLAQFLVRLSGFVGPAGGNAPAGSLAAGVAEALEAALLATADAGMPGGPADAQIQSLSAAVARMPPLPLAPPVPGLPNLPPREPPGALFPLPMWTPPGMAQSGNGGVGDVSMLPPIPPAPAPTGADDLAPLAPAPVATGALAPLAPVGGVCSCLCPLPPMAEVATPTSELIPGEVKAYAGTAGSVPAMWALCDGAAVSRTTYADLFTALGTAWGIGDGSTTFNLPDLRGRVLAGIDDMGGVPANRVTAGGSGVPGDTLGGAGGDEMAQTDTLTSTSVVTDPQHDHDITLGFSNVSATGAQLTVLPGLGPTSTLYTTDPASTGITVATTTTSALVGSAQNMPPVAMINWIIYLGA